jgi:hypothetical protein
MSALIAWLNRRRACAALVLIGLSLSGLAASLEARPKLAVLPFGRQEGVSDNEYQQVQSAFYLSLSTTADVEMVTTFDLLGLLNEGGRSREILENDASLYKFAREKGIDLLVLGRVELQGDDAGQRSVGLRATLASAAKERIFNSVAWSASLNFNRQQNAQRLIDLSAMAAQKLLWKRPDLYPLSIRFDTENPALSERVQGARFRQRVNELIEAAALPPGAEIDAVHVNVRETKSVAPTGVLGCLTLVGWMVLPYYNVDYNLDILVRVKRLEPGGVEFSELRSVAADSQLFHLLSGAQGRSEPSNALLEKAAGEIRAQIQNDRGLHQNREALLREFFPR